MLKEIRTLTTLEFRDLFGLNKFRYGKDKKARNRYLLLGIVWILLILMVVGYVGGYTYGLVILGIPNTVVPYLVLISSILVLVFDIFKAGSTIFSQKSYDILCSLPIHSSSLVVARFLGMYVTDLLLTYLILIPGTVVYGVLLRPDFGFYMMLFLGSLFIPMLPLVAATLIGTLITALSSRMKNTALAQTLLTIIFVLVMLIPSFSLGEAAEEISTEMILTLLTQIDALIGKLYPPALWLQKACLFGDFLGLFLFIGSAVLAFGIMLGIVSKNFHSICGRLFATSASHNYEMETLKSTDLLWALYHREWKRYFASSIYVTNTIIGPILGTLMCGAFLFGGMEVILSEFPPLPFDIELLVPFMVAGIFTTMTVTSVSISMEGKEVWLIKTLPIPVKTLWDSKILLNLSLIAPFFVVSEVFLILAFHPDFIEMLLFILIPTLVILFAVVLGITINLKLHSFNWENEAYVVKQSASAGIGGFAGMFVSLACGALVAILPEDFRLLGNLGICIGLVFTTVLLYRQNNKVKLEKL